MGQSAFGGVPAPMGQPGMGGGGSAFGGPGAPDGNGGRNLPVPVGPVRPGSAAPEPQMGFGPERGGPGGRQSKFALSNWRVRWRLIAIIVVPTVAALILGVIEIGGAVNNYNTFQREKTLATLNQAVVGLSANLENERDQVAGYIAAGRSSGLSAVTADENATNSSVAQVQNLANGVISGSGYNSTVVSALQDGVTGRLDDLTNIRDDALKTEAPALSIMNVYEQLISGLDTFSADIADGTSDITLQTDVNELGALLRAEDDASQQRGILFASLSSNPMEFAPTGLSDLNQEQQQQTADQNQFEAVASVTETQDFENSVSNAKVEEAQAEETLAIARANAGDSLTIFNGSTVSAECLAAGATTQPSCWSYDQSAQITDMRDVSTTLVGDISTQADSLASSALKDAAIIGALLLILLLIVLVLTTIVARSMIRPLRRLRSDALDVAGNKLPAMVRRLSESEGSDESIEIEPIGVNSTDEIGEVARAFDQVHREAVRLAADEAMLRGNLNAMFVNLSRRSQSLIERQLTLIDNLEQGEQDGDRLSSLFRLDHLATRMRRNSENLLVLAGHEASRRWSQPVPLVDVLRAAISEIEQYERVVLNVQPGIVIVGQAVNDVVHLVAEIVENATTFSPEDTQVYVTGQPLTSGGVLLDITDNGVGISEQEMAHANWRLDNPPVVDVAVSRRMGLFVVGRLAARHGIRVRLRHAQSGGLTALIWLPDSVATAEVGGQPGIGRLRRFEPEDFGPAPSLSAPPATATLPGFSNPAPAASGPAPAGRGSAFGAPSGGSPAGPQGGTASGNAAAASRIPRFASGPSNGGSGGLFDGGGNNAPAGGFASSGAGNNGPTAGYTNGGGGNGTPAGGFGNGGSGNGAPSGGFASGGPANGGGGNLTPAGGFPGAGNASGTGPQLPVRPTPGAGAGDKGTRLPSFGGDAGTGPMKVGAPANGGSDGVAVPPPAASLARGASPIFDSLESDWFRRSGKSLNSEPAEKSAAQTWSSPADEGWRAARVAAAPQTGDTTTAGLPKRVPRANLVPGSVGAASAAEDSGESVAPSRSADDIRSRMSSFQRGVRDARAAAPQDEEP